MRSGWRFIIIRFALASGILCSRSAALGSAEDLQGSAKEMLEISGAGFALSFSDGGFGGARVVSEIDKGGDHVGFDACRRAGGGTLGRLDGHGIEFVFEFNDHALGGFAADTGDSCQATKIAVANGGPQFFVTHNGRN